MAGPEGTFRRWRGLLRRRELLQGGAAAVVGLGAGGLGASQLLARDLTEDPAGGLGEPRVRRYRKLGRTGLEISDISFGSSRSADPELVRHALARGVNYFDTAEGYKRGRSEEAIGEALVGRRNEVFIASKVKAEADATLEELMRALEGSLERLRTDRIDIYFNHAVNNLDRLKNGAWFEFVRRAKEQGKIRFTGMSGHGGRLIECLDYALDNELIDAMLVAYNFGQDPAFYNTLLDRFDFITLQPELPRVLEKAHALGVGVLTMKTLMGARLNDMRPWEEGGRTFAQAGFRWVLSNPNVDALVISMKSKKSIDEFLGASGSGPIDTGDLELLRRYAHANGGGYCRPGCDACLSSCPYGVDIPEVLRTRMYARDYDDLELAHEDHAKLAVTKGVSPAGACLSCSGTPCLGACPFGLAIPALTRDAARLFSS